MFVLTTRAKIFNYWQKESVEKYQQKFFFKSLLKLDNAKLFLMSYGKAFHSVEAATEKNLAPYLFKLYCRVKIAVI